MRGILETSSRFHTAGSKVAQHIGDWKLSHEPFGRPKAHYELVLNIPDRRAEKQDY